jgi:dipeptidyl aminopeptidase/acylaminoacyl peptidase
VIVIFQSLTAVWGLGKLIAGYNPAYIESSTKQLVLESVLKITSTVLISATMLSLGGPILAEMASTAAPLYTKGADRGASALGLKYESVSFQSPDGITLRGWYFPAAITNSPAILYAPATAKDQRSGLSLVKPLHAAGYSVLLFSYRGHGRSDGNRVGFSYGAHESLDVDAAASYLHDVRGASAVGAIGHSAGAVAIILSAARNPKISVVVAASPFASVEEIWYTNKPDLVPTPMFDIMMRTSELRKDFERDQVRPVDVISRIAPRPILILHGTDDRRITEEQARLLFNQAAEPKEFWLLDGLSHAEVRSIGIDDHIQEIILFMNQAIAPEYSTVPPSI